MDRCFDRRGLALLDTGDGKPRVQPERWMGFCRLWKLVGQYGHLSWTIRARQQLGFPKPPFSVIKDLIIPQQGEHPVEYIALYTCYLLLYTSHFMSSEMYYKNKLHKKQIPPGCRMDLEGLVEFSV